MKIRLMLADDHRMFREALRVPLRAEADLEIVAEAGSGQETLNEVDRTLPDVLLLDIALPDMSGIEVAARVFARHPEIRIVALSGYTERMYVSEMMKAGARAYVVKSAGADELVRAIHAVVAGNVFLSPEVTAGIVSHVAPASENPAAAVLGAREREVLHLLATGMQSAEIAGRLGISTETVKTHRRNIKQKLGITSTAELTRYAIREGL